MSWVRPVCVMINGKPVVDLWGGTARKDTDQKWERDTLSVVWSSTKGAVSFCAHLLASRGELDIDAPVADYWPEYAQNGKESTTVKMLFESPIRRLRSQRNTPPLVPTRIGTRWSQRIERQGPIFRARDSTWLSGINLMVGSSVEVIRRVSGQSLGEFFRQANWAAARS